ncbi:MAG: hypothetical protein JXR10_09960 [Cyclobacteriaceae bacterium]
MNPIAKEPQVERTLYYFVTAICVATVLISGGDTYNYFANDYGILSWVNLGLNITITLLTFLFMLGRVSLPITLGTTVYMTMGVVFFTNFYLRETGVPTWENNYLRDIPILFVYMFALCMILSLKHIIVYNAFHITYCIFMLIGSGSDYLAENTVTIIASLLGFSYLMYWFVNRLKESVAQTGQLKEQVRMEEAKALQDRLDAKDRELAYKAMMMARNSETSEKLLSDLNAIKAKVDGEVDDDIRRVISNARFSSREELWSEFQRRFIDIHKDFASNLLAAFPDLTKSEIKLASLLKLDLSSKEIAQLLGNTRESVDVSRSRLRKKMKLSTGDDLLQELGKY